MMNEHNFQSIRRLVHEQSGIDLKEGKSAMVAARIGRRLRELQLDTAEQYIDHLGQNADEIVKLLDVISTNVTRFFREKPHFEFLDKTLTKWFSQGQKQLRIWSAASSTGEEPYSVAMTVHEVQRRMGMQCDFRMLATDISTRVLEYAQAGRYDASKIESVPAELLKRYFKPVQQAGNTCHEVNTSLREQIMFRRLNLNQPPFPMNGPLDIVFCCNVMIYFDGDTKRHLLNDVRRLLKPDGYLIVSHTENLTGVTRQFTAIQPSIYKLAPSKQLIAVHAGQEVP